MALLNVGMSTWLVSTVKIFLFEAFVYFVVGFRLGKILRYNSLQFVFLSHKKLLFCLSNSHSKKFVLKDYADYPSEASILIRGNYKNKQIRN